jgi:nitroreductase
MYEKKASTSVEISPLLSNRWSPRSFNPEKEVSMEQIKSLAEAARWSASCSNEQPWNVLFASKFIDKQSFDNVFDSLAVGNQKWCKNATCFAVIIAREYFLANESENNWAGFDCGAATTSMMLQAKELGLVTHPLAGFEPAKIKEYFEIPDRHTVYAILAIGYQDVPEKLEEPFQSREKADRQRKDIKSNFFLSSWGKEIR